jgi:predicted nucleotidyltransferase
MNTKNRTYVRKIKKYLNFEVYVKDMLDELINSKVKAKVLKFMVVNYNKSFTPTEIAAFCKLSKSRVGEILRGFEKDGIVLSQEIGRSILYSLNLKNDDVKIMLRLFKADYKKSYDILDEFVKKCRKLFGDNLLSIVLFGSRARGVEKQRSDFDLIVITKQKSDRLTKLVGEFTKKSSIRFDVTILDKEEFLDNLYSFSPLFVTMALGVKILFDRNFFADRFKEFVKKLFDAKFVYYESGQRWDIRKIGSRTLQSL